MSAIERVAKNEDLYREVNERIRELTAETATPLHEPASFVCECGDGECHDPIRLSLAEYLDVRSDPRYFAVVPGHVYTDEERVVRQNDRFAVIEKTGRLGELVETVDD